MKPFRLINLLLIVLFFLSSGLVHAEVKMYGFSYVSLNKVAKQLRGNLHTKGKKVILKTPHQSYLFEQHKRKAFLNGNPIALGAPVVKKYHQFFIAKQDYETLLHPLANPTAIKRNQTRLKKIVLDAGHGGKQTGSINQSLKLVEKKYTLDLAIRVAHRLKKKGYKVYLTRSEDKALGLKERSAFANKVSADLFISLHFNSVKSSKVRGIETFVLSPKGLLSFNQPSIHRSIHEHYSGHQFNQLNTLLAYIIQTSLIKKTQTKDRGVKRARFGVLKNLNCPGILVELGFLSNFNEGRKIQTETYRNQLADAIVSGIINYHRVCFPLGS